MENIVKKRPNRPVQSVLQKRQKRLHSGGESFMGLLPKLKATSTKQDIINGLKELVGRTCLTNSDKFHLLQHRDVLLYKLRDITSDQLGSRQITQGSCPDMCPEKERYMRDAKKTVHFYECNSQGQMVHEKMVKDYSRSAADQDTPLAHELRPLKTLQLTMDYLIFNIAGEIPSTSSNDLARWYDFLWSRTRAIRKDITQQMLNNEMAVDLVEKCARLHIFASFGLVELEADLFDHKMNTENLSKSLQTLRHMYDDLAKKQIFCVNESEFRSYDILLNLSDFNVHSQVLSYRASVRANPQVQLALSLSSALQNNNYIRFFRLVRLQATFLQACLCHHFFPLIRSNALKVICMAYNIFPIETFVEYLSFDSMDEAMKFIGQFNLEMDATDPNLINVRDGRNFFLPGGDAPNAESIQRTKCYWIEQKAHHLTLPKVLCNNPSAVRPGHLNAVSFPVDSFSKDSGAYVNDPVLKELIELHGSSFATARKNMRVEAPPSFSFVRAIQPFQSVFKPFRQIGVSSMLDANNNTEQQLLSMREHLLEKVVLTELTAIAGIAFENTIRNNLRTRKALRRWISFVAKKKQQRMANALASELIERVVSRQFHLSVNKIFSQRMALEMAVSQSESVLDQIVPKLLHSIVYRIRANKARHINEKMHNIRENLHRAWLRQFADHWLAVVRRNRILRNITFLTSQNGNGTLTLSPSQPLFRPNAKKMTPERMKQMAAEKMRQMENQRKKRWLRRFADHWLAVVRRNRILRNIAFQTIQNGNGSLTLSPSQPLFRPNVKEMAAERMKQMAAQKMRQLEEEQKKRREERNAQFEFKFMG
ncbi:hypothetical protein niasHT_008018 [Heterodera trifolii]|uniref:PCI domain-containing protein n=1 Tax=Heterodera trifolii TaxID=157864 RepID=A0ABD2LZR6_9BILA